LTEEMRRSAVSLSFASAVIGQAARIRGRAGTIAGMGEWTVTWAVAARDKKKSGSLGQSRFKRVDRHARGARRTTSAKSTLAKASETAVRYMEQPLL
jgi:hypothetical protein